MSEQMMPANGTFCWNELSTNDSAAALNFYKELLGWQFKESQMDGVVYNEIMVGGRHIGGVYEMGGECAGGGEGAPAMPPHWMAYVAVEDVDEKAKRVVELGGSVCVPPTDIPNTGRFCVINDPTGATISLITLKGAHD